MRILICTIVALVLVVFLSSCGLVSGTVFVSQGVDDTINARSSGDGIRGGGFHSLDAQMDGAVVDLTDNSDYGNIDVDGIEAGCVVTHAINCNDTLPISGEIWVVLDTAYSSDIPDSIRAHGFRVFHGIALEAGQERDFTCEETLELLENVDQLADAVAIGYFKAWGMGDQDTYCITLTNIFIGLFLTGSL